MNQIKAKNAIEVASNIVVVLVGVIVLGGIVRNYLLATPAHLVLQNGLKRGARFPPLPGVDLSRSPKTLLVAMDPKCDSCNESLLFFKELAETIRGRYNDVRMIALFSSGEADATRYAQQSQLNVDTIFGIDFKRLNLSGIPAMILIDNNGTVVNFWLGKLSKETETQIISSL